ncbi:hypothetical protein ACIRPK_06405 [Kitasatospora sp. NPDC101801]|uniref:hypothetical protein n=1 Tax=Kitasatospora sp. NPDC101801 TaxID=3364103 RepID=UPI0038026062
MAVLIHAVVPGITVEQYDALNARLQQTPGIFDGCLSHVCAPTDQGLEIFDVWASEQQMTAFADRMMPIAVEQGWPATPGRPEVLPVHNYWTPKV